MECEREGIYVWHGLGSIGKDVGPGAPFLGVRGSFVAIRLRGGRVGGESLGRAAVHSRVRKGGDGGESEFPLVLYHSALLQTTTSVKQRGDSSNRTFLSCHLPTFSRLSLSRKR